MASAFSPLLNFELMANGEDNNTWGDKFNANIGLIDDAIGTTTTINSTGGSVTLTEAQRRSAVLKITGVLASDLTITVGNIAKWWIIYNLTTGAHVVKMKTASGTALVVSDASQSTTNVAICNGSNVIYAGATS